MFLVSLSTIFEAAKHDARIADKDIQVDLAFRHQPEWSKRKYNVDGRDIGMHRFAKPKSLQRFRIAFLRRWLAAELAESGQPDLDVRDLLLEILMTLKGKQAKANLALTEESEVA